MFIVEVVLDTKCNLGCYFCFAKNKSGITVPISSIKKVLENLDNLTTEKIVQFKYYGGEAMLSQDLLIEHFKLISSHYSNKEFRIVLITNGTIYPNTEMIEMIKKGIVTITFSMEGNREQHNNIRKFLSGRGSFDIVIENIKRLALETNRRFLIQTVMSNEWIRDIDKYIDFTEEYKDIADFCGVPMFGTFEITNEMLNKFGSALEKYTNKMVEDYEKYGYSNLLFFHEMRAMMKLLSTHEFKNSQFHCLAGYEQITLVGEDLYPCSRAYHNKMYFSKYKDMEEYKKQRESYKQQVSQDFNCISCQKKNFIGCIGSCLISTWQNNNTLLEEVCRYNIIFGKHTNNLFKRLITNKNFIEDFKNMLLVNLDLTEDISERIKKILEV